MDFSPAAYPPVRLDLTAKGGCGNLDTPFTLQIGPLSQHLFLKIARRFDGRHQGKSSVLTPCCIAILIATGTKHTQAAMVEPQFNSAFFTGSAGSGEIGTPSSTRSRTSAEVAWP